MFPWLKECSGEENRGGSPLLRSGNPHIVVVMEGGCNGKGIVTVMGAVIVHGL